MAEGNARIAERFEELALLLEIEGENPFRIRAYREAAETIRGHAEPMGELVRRGEDLSELHGIGKATAGKIAEMVETGRLAALDAAIERVGSGIALLLRVPGFGPKRLRALREELGSGDASAIAAALEAGRVRAVPGFGAGLEEKVREALAQNDEEG